MLGVLIDDPDHPERLPGVHHEMQLRVWLPPASGASSARLLAAATINSELIRLLTGIHSTSRDACSRASFGRRCDTLGGVVDVEQQVRDRLVRESRTYLVRSTTKSTTGDGRSTDSSGPPMAILAALTAQTRGHDHRSGKARTATMKQTDHPRQVRMFRTVVSRGQ